MPARQCVNGIVLRDRLPLGHSRLHGQMADHRVVAGKYCARQLGAM